MGLVLIFQRRKRSLGEATLSALTLNPAEQARSLPHAEPPFSRPQFYLEQHLQAARPDPLTCSLAVFCLFTWSPKPKGKILGSRDYVFRL